MPFELFGTSLFGDPELDEDLEISIMTNSMTISSSKLLYPA
ncbi:MAG: hypothetical protein R2849_04005 [Thermomicrobiales bacterium]